LSGGVAEATVRVESSTHLTFASTLGGRFESRTEPQAATDNRMLPMEATPSRHVSVPETSYEEIYKTHFDFVWRNVRRLGVPEASIDDAVQDVFGVVHRRLGDFEGRSTIRTWLFGILARVAMDHRRSHARQAQKAVAFAAEAEPDAAPTPADLVGRREAARILEQFLDEMDNEKREIFVLVELEQMSVADAAEALSLNVNTAHARLRVARTQFEDAVAGFRAREKRR
jgi:RNA polymerase sigma-70 factor (ECF subfamily)